MYGVHSVWAAIRSFFVFDLLFLYKVPWSKILHFPSDYLLPHRSLPSTASSPHVKAIKAFDVFDQHSKTQNMVWRFDTHCPRWEQWIFSIVPAHSVIGRWCKSMWPGLVAAYILKLPVLESCRMPASCYQQKLTAYVWDLDGESNGVMTYSRVSKRSVV